MNNPPNNPPPPPAVATADAIEWLSLKEAVKRFNVSRSSLYNLLSAGLIKSRSLRITGNIRGRRLLSAESLRLFIEGQPS